MTTNRLMAGYSEREITPKIGVKLAEEFTPRIASGVSTPLMAKCLVLSNGEELSALITLDLFGVHPTIADQMALQVSKECEIHPAAVMIICSHTRGAPYTTPVVGGNAIDEAYLKEVSSKLPAMVLEAKRTLQKASLGLFHAELPHLAYNHRLLTRNMKTISAWLGTPKNEVLAPEGPVDSTFSVFVIRDEHGFPITLLWNFAADQRFQSGDQISAGLPYYVQQEVEKRSGRHIPCLYLPGCGGNISYTHGFEVTVDAVASAVMAVQLETPCDPLVKLGWMSKKMILPVRDYSEYYFLADVEMKYPQAVEVYRQELEYLRQEKVLAVPTEIRVWRLGRFALVGLGGMPFTELALGIKNNSPFRDCVVAGNVGGYIGVICSRAAFEGGGYETWTARSALIGIGGGEFMVEQAHVLLNRLFKYN